MSIVSLLLVFPMLVMLMELVIVGGRIAVVTNDIQSAAREAARQASIASGRSSALGLIDPVVETSLANRDVECSGGPQVILTGVYAPGGEVTVEVVCRVRVNDVDWFPIVPFPRVRVERQATEPIDQYRIVAP